MTSEMPVNNSGPLQWWGKMDIQEGIYSQRLNVAPDFAIATDTTGVYARMPVEAFDADGTAIGRGTTDEKGNTPSFFTHQPTEITIHVGNGDWRLFVDEHDSEDYSKNTDAATSEAWYFALNFLDFEGLPINALRCRLTVGGRTFEVCTNSKGEIPDRVDVLPASLLRIEILKANEEYKLIFEYKLGALRSSLTAISPKKIYVVRTVLHEGEAGAAEEKIVQIRTDPNATAGETIAGDTGEVVVEASNSVKDGDQDTEHPLAGTPSIAASPDKSAIVDTASLRRSASAVPSQVKLSSPPQTPRKTPSCPPGSGRSGPLTTVAMPPEVGVQISRLVPGRDSNGNPLAVIVRTARDAIEVFRSGWARLWSHADFDRVRSGTPTNPATLVPMKESQLKLIQTLLRNATEQTAWNNLGTPATVLSQMESGRFSAPDAKESSRSLGLCARYINIALARSRVIDGFMDLPYGSVSGPQLISKGFIDVTNEVPDARWASPGDVIVYLWTDDAWERRRQRFGREAKNYGHVDIRSYEGYISDFIPVRGKSFGTPVWSDYTKIRIYRKYCDPLPDLRLRSFLRCLRQWECTSIHDDAERYLALNSPLPNTRGLKFSGFSKHPWADSFSQLGRSQSSAAGAYQITYATWKSSHKNLDLHSGTDLFSPAVQDRLAVYLIDARRALEDIRCGKIEEGVRKLTEEWSCLPGASQNRAHMGMTDFIALFNFYLTNETEKRGIS